MKGGTKVMLAVLILTLPVAAPARLVRVVGTTAIWTGSYIQDDPSQNLTGRCPATGCVGDLVTCGPSEKITITKKTYSFVARVCDDTDDSMPPCAGRFTGLAEECQGPEDVLGAGPFTVGNSTGQIRFCLDSGDCTGASPATVVGTGSSRTQRRLSVGSSEAFGVSTIMGKATVDTHFTFEGGRERFFHGKRLVDFTTLEANGGDNCGGECAVAGLSITDQT